ncbi:MAG: hypothetical protein QOC82_1924 [Frankiaceae bacterium]|nr:hypothetical protein [Frankiaceae bacterium]
MRQRSFENDLRDAQARANSVQDVAGLPDWVHTPLRLVNEFIALTAPTSSGRRVGISAKAVRTAVEDGRAIPLILDTLSRPPTDSERSVTEWAYLLDRLRVVLQIAAERGATSPRVSQLRTSLELSLNSLYVRSANLAGRRASRAASSAQRVATDKAAETLYEHFDAVHREEERRGNVFRLATILMIGATAIATGALDLSSSTTTTLETVRRIGVAVPGLLLAAYLGRQGWIHLAVARWAQSLAVQLKSIRAYADGMSAEAREKLLASFGERIFTGRQPVISARVDRQSTDDLEALLQRLTELVNATASKEP